MKQKKRREFRRRDTRRIHFSLQNVQSVFPLGYIFLTFEVLSVRWRQQILFNTSHGFDMQLGSSSSLLSSGVILPERVRIFMANKEGWS